MIEPYILLEEKLTTRFDDPISSESHSTRTIENESHWHRDDSDQGMLIKYDNYTPLIVS